jgi:hypothetical protein
MSFYKTEAIKDIFPKENFRLFERPTPKQSYHSEKLEQLEKLIDFEPNLNSLRNAENKVLPMQSKENIIELETLFFERHREYLITIYKHFSDIFYDNNFSIFMNYNGFLKFMKDINLVYFNAEKICRPSSISMRRTKEGGNYLNDKLKSNLFSLNTLNLIFSKFSNETQAPVKRDANLNINIFKKTSTGVYASKESNKKINFKSFIKILLLISNKLFNPIYKPIQIDLQKDFNLDKLLLADSKQMMHYLELLVDNYLKPCYNNIKTFIEKESYDLMLLETILNDQNVDIFFTKMKPSLRKIFFIYTDSREEIYLDEFSRYFCFYLLDFVMISKYSLIYARKVKCIIYLSISLRILTINMLWKEIQIFQLDLMSLLE